ncbi:MAG: cytochrome b/b6 domain-containing protein [Firmicutes bacterium]|nr:cytochrome b/b6 domain-containing protein [Bacillota bacterium]
MKRLVTALVLLAIFAEGTYLAYKAAQLYIYRAVFAGSYTYNLLFTSSSWLLPIAIFLGIYVGATVKRRESELTDGKVLRHDETAFLIHWSHALSTLVLIGTGIYLGFFFFPRLVHSPEQVGFVLNLHFVGVVVFLFSISLHLTDMYVTGKIKEHLPEPGDFQDAIAHYVSKLGIGRKPKEGKYLASEKLSYPMWIVSVGLVLITGFIKVAAHRWSIPGGVMGAVTWLHDLGALLVGINLVVHIIMSSVMPWSWPLLRSMLTGYVSEEYVRKHHAKWYEELANQPLKEAESTGKETQIPVSS